MWTKTTTRQLRKVTRPTRTGAIGSNQYRRKPKDSKRDFNPMHYLLYLAELWLVVIVLALLFKQLPCLENPKQAQAAGRIISPLVEDGQAQASPSAVLTPEPTKAPQTRVEKLQAELLNHDSPLAPYAAYIVAQADQYAIPWTLTTSISRAESSFCTNTIAGSFNCWGIGGAHGFYHFKDYKDGIHYVSALLGKNYKWNANRGIQLKYCPPSDNCSEQWTETVTSTEAEIMNL